MNRFSSISTIWQTLHETDISPLRQQALRGIDIAIVGDPGVGRSALADQMRRDPNQLHLVSEAPVRILDLDSAELASSADLIIMIVLAHKPDQTREQELALKWQAAQKRILILIIPQAEPGSQAISLWTSKARRRVLLGSISDLNFLIEKFAPAVIDLVPELVLTLGRYFPLFRIPIAQYLIKDTSLSNAAYSMSTGLVQTVTILDIPITITDTIVLTKAQAFLVYKLGLVLGYSTRWQDYIAEFGGVLGSGFVFRQTARSLIGLIPVWGIIPKTAIAYAGTYVVGNVVLQWYLTGRHLTSSQMRQLYTQAFGRGQSQARSLFARLPHPHIKLKLPRLRRRAKAQPKPALPAPRQQKTHRRIMVCARCGKSSAPDAGFCQYCGAPFEKVEKIS